VLVNHATESPCRRFDPSMSLYFRGQVWHLNEILERFLIVVVGTGLVICIESKITEDAIDLILTKGSLVSLKLPVLPDQLRLIV
jgi:hypothetical protein